MPVQSVFGLLACCRCVFSVFPRLCLFPHMGLKVLEPIALGSRRLVVVRLLFQRRIPWELIVSTGLKVYKL